MIRSFRSLAGILILGTSIGCGGAGGQQGGAGAGAGGPGGEPTPVCDPGETQQCACVGGSVGAQQCLTARTGWGGCECAPTPESPDDPPEPEPLRVQGSVSYPFIVDAFGQRVFPTYLAHLLGTGLDVPWIGRDLACVTLTATASADVVVEASLTGYSAPATRLVSLSKDRPTEECLSPTPDLRALHALNSPAPSTVTVVVRSNDDTRILFEDTLELRVSTRSDVFWAMNGADALESVAALVRPHEPGIQGLLDDMVERSEFDGSIGVGGYRADRRPSAWWPQKSYRIGAGGWNTTSFFLESGRGIDYFADSDGADSWLLLFNYDNFELWRDGDESARAYVSTNIAARYDDSFVAPSDGYYVMAFMNQSLIFAETIATSRTMTRADNVIDYLAMVFNYLREFGINYVNVPNSFFGEAQHVVLPDEVVSNGGGNCIDGTLLFASLLELMGVRAEIVFVPGHAFVAVRSAPGAPGDETGISWALETTMVGNPDISFTDALNHGGRALYDGFADGSIDAIVEVDVARSLGIAAMP